MLGVLRRGIIELPYQIAFPVVFLDSAALASSAAERAFDHAGAHQVAVFQEINRLSRLIAASRPDVNRLALVVDEIGAAVMLRRKQRVAGPGPAVVDKKADGLAGGGKSGGAAGRSGRRGRPRRGGRRGRACGGGRRGGGWTGKGGGHLLRGTYHPEADMEPGPVRVIEPVGRVGAAVILRIAVGDPGMPRIGARAVVPVAAAHPPVRLSVRHQESGVGTFRIIRGTDAVIILAVPVLDHLPGVAGHVVKPIAIGVVESLVAALPPRPAVVRLLAKLPVVESHRGGPGHRPAFVGIPGAGIVGPGQVGAVPPGVIEIGVVLASPARKLPLRFGRKAVAVAGEIAGPGGQIVAGLVAVAGAEPVAVGDRAEPPQAGDRVVPPGIQNREAAAVPVDAAVAVGLAGHKVKVAAAHGKNRSAGYPDLALGQGRIQVVAELLNGNHRLGHVKGTDPYGVDGNFIAGMGGIHKTVMIAHIKLPRGDEGVFVFSGLRRGRQPQNGNRDESRHDDPDGSHSHARTLLDDRYTFRPVRRMRYQGRRAAGKGLRPGRAKFCIPGNRCR